MRLLLPDDGAHPHRFGERGRQLDSQSRGLQGVVAALSYYARAQAAETG
jgi:hypothetical protein